MITDLILISGFLGSGKTTLLKNLLSLHKGKRIAVIQNEFAPSGVDGKELQLTDTSFKLVEINNGSVFCVCLLSNFIENITKLITEYNPEIIYLEASGISDPISICELLNNEAINFLVEQISNDLKDETPLFIGILNGSFMFVADFVRK